MFAALLEYIKRAPIRSGLVFGKPAGTPTRLSIGDSHTQTNTWMGWMHPTAALRVWADTPLTGRSNLTESGQQLVSCFLSSTTWSRKLR